MITTKGAGFLAVAILVFLAGRMTLVGWLYLVDAVLWGIIILSAIVPWMAIPFLAAERRVHRTSDTAGRTGPAEGDQVRIELTLRNRTFVPRFLFTVFYECPVADPLHYLQRFFVAQLPGSGRITLESTIEAYKRGLHSLGPVVFESSAPFGLFRRRIKATGLQPVLIFPRVHQLRRLALVEALAGSTAQPRKSITGMDPVGSRHYFPGDPRRHIHWRNTARMGRPMVKEFEDAQDPTLDLLYDATQVFGEGKDTTLEYAIKLVASAAGYAARNRGSVRVWGGRAHGETCGDSGLDDMNLSELLESLARVEGGEGMALTQSLSQLPVGASALVVVSAGDAQAIQLLSQIGPTLHRIAVVVLEGFGPPEDNLSLKALESLGAAVIKCRPGGLMDTFQALEHLGGPLLTTVSGAAATISGGRG